MQGNKSALTFHRNVHLQYDLDQVQVMLKNLPDENQTHLLTLKIFMILLFNTCSWKLLGQNFLQY